MSKHMERIKDFRYAAQSIPQHMHDALAMYLDHGIAPGDFLTAVLQNNLLEAAGRADGENIRCLHVYAVFLYNEAPRDSYGSVAKVKEWIEAKKIQRNQQEQQNEHLSNEEPQ